MGIFIHLEISKSITRKEWEDVYNETLVLVDKFPLSERIKADIHGVDTICLAQTTEHIFPSSWGDKEKIGWATDGDLVTLRTAEEYFLPRDLIGEETVDEKAGDAILGACPAYLNYDFEDDRFVHAYHKWGSKTQGEPYHLYLLAIACLIEARLGTKAFVYGDITRGQCKKAVDLANKILENKIDMPDRCYVDRLMQRVRNLDFSEKEKIDIFETFYLGTKDASFGETMREYFSKESLNDYWEKRFEHSKIGTVGFNNIVGEYLLWGFEIDTLCKYIIFKDADGNTHYEEFVKRIMDAKLHLKEKNCKDPLMIDQEEEQPYSIWTLFAQFGFAGARNNKVDRYVPIEDIRSALRKGMAGKIDVDPIIDEYLKAESEQSKIKIRDNFDITQEELEQAAKQDSAETFSQMMETTRNVVSLAYSNYDINDLDDLIDYKSGKKVRKGLTEALGKSMLFLEEILSEPEYTELLKESTNEKYKWVVSQNRCVLIRKEDWEKIYRNLEDDPKSFGRYYSLMRVDTEKGEIYKMVRALMINDDLYHFSKELAETIKDTENKKDSGEE